MYSLHQRLTLSLAASLALFFIAQTALIGREVESLSEQNLLSRLHHDQETILAALSWQPPAPPSLNTQRIPEIYKRPFSGHYYQLDFGTSTLYSRSLWDETLPILHETVAHDIPGPSAQRLLVLTQTIWMHGQPVHIQTAEDISHMETVTSRFQRHLLLFAAIAVLLLLLLQSWLIRNGLKPLQRIRQQLRQLEQGEIDRVTVPTPREIKPLVEEINRLVQLIRSRINRSRHALGDLAHAVKTPLAVMGQILQRQPVSQDSKQLCEQLQQIEQRIQREMARARTAGSSPGGNWSQPEPDLQDIIMMLRHIFPSIHIQLNMPAGMVIAADREDMLEILGNLLENACKWANSTVLCHIEKAASHLKICVQDDGPGVAEDGYDKLLERGARLDESRPGHGLGLAIVREIVDAYQGSITLGQSEQLGGLNVSILLPQP